VVTTVLQRFASIAPMFCIFLLWCSAAPASAATPDMGLGQYAHRAWKFDDGFAVPPPILAIAQTPDGYLWLGTHTGLWRFDGVNAVPWRSPDGQHLPDNWVGTLATQNRTLWIGTSGGLASWRNGKLTSYPALAGQDVLTILVDREGTVWAGTESRATSTGRLCAIRDNAVRCYGEDGSLGQRIYCLYEDGDGHLWLASSKGLWLWRPGSPRLYPEREPVPGYFHSLTSGADGALFFSGYDGIQEVVGGRLVAFPVTLDLPPGQPPRVLTDTQGGLWLGTINGGLRYIHAGRVDSFAKSDGLSGNRIGTIFEDREGDIWVGTVSGLDEFWRVAAASFSDEQGLSEGVSATLADVDGSIWFATPTGLYRRKDGELTVYRGPERRGKTPAQGTAQSDAREVIVRALPTDTSGSLYQDHRGRIWLGSPSGLGYLWNSRFVSIPGVPRGPLNCITEDDQGNLWIAHRKLGLFRLSPDGQVKLFSWVDLGIGETWRIAFDPLRHGLWLGSSGGRIAFFAEGRIRATYTAGFPGKQAVRDLRLDPDGTLWAATEGGLIILRNGRLTTLTGNNGLPCDVIYSTIDDGAGSIWLHTACGLVRLARADLPARIDSTTRVSIRTTVLDASDGVANSGGGGSFGPNVAKSPDGRLWFANSDGAMMVDPRHLALNALAPPVQIEQITAGGRSYDASPHLRLPPLLRDLEIDYAALSFAAPEKNQFRYKLEGHDRDWVDPGNRRQAFYTDLPPGQYRFRVIASNNSGVWNTKGATLDFSVAPAFWQTWWFCTLCAIALAAILWGIYQLRMRQLAHEAALAREVEARELEMRLELAHENRLATLGQLTASIAHEVNQPLSAAVNYANAALRWLKAQPPDLNETQDALDAVVRAGNRASEIVGRIRAMVKKAPAEDEDVSLNEKILAVLTLTRGEAARHEVTVRVELARDLPTVKGDRVQLQQVLLNLIVNAIEAMSTLTEGPRELVVGSQPHGEGGVAVFVRDTGPGLAPEALEQVFQPFYTSKGSGLGMGLPICASIIEAHGGRIWASPNTPRGAVFQFTLPASRPS